MAFLMSAPLYSKGGEGCEAVREGEVQRERERGQHSATFYFMPRWLNDYGRSKTQCAVNR